MKRPDTVTQKVHVKLGDVLQLVSEWKVGQLRETNSMSDLDTGRMEGLTYSLQTLGLVPDDSMLVNKVLREGKGKSL